MTPVIIDVDTGIDDAFGLLYALAEPTIRLLGVSSVAGNVGLAKATRNTRQILALGGRPDIPVWPGCASPILYAPEDASIVHGDSGLGHAILPEPVDDPDAPHAIDAILAASRAHARELVLVATGPLTNIAAALLRDPTLPTRVNRLVLMGGAFRVAGNVTPAAEFNIWHDPEAARIVFRAFGGAGSAPLVAVGLDVTHQVRIVEADLDALALRCQGSPQADAIISFLRDSARHYFQLMIRWGRGPYLFMHDPLAVAAAFHPDLLKTESVAVDIEITGELTRGATIADWRGLWGRPKQTQVAVDVDSGAFRDLYFETIARLCVAK